MAQEHRVAKVGDIEAESGKHFKIGDLEIAVWNNEGKFYATDAICTHAWVSLIDGYVEDGCVECPLHAGRFEVHGKVVDPRLRTVAASAPAFPADFTTRIPLETPCIGFTYRQAKKDLDVVILKQSAAQRMASPANAA